MKKRLAAMAAAFALGTALSVSAASTSFLVDGNTVDTSAPLTEATELATNIPCMKMRIGADTWSYTSDGKTWKFYHNEHCVVLCGYDPVNHKVLISDSLSGLIWRDEAKFRQIYDALGKMAVVIF